MLYLIYTKIERFK